ncbi:hypothetical protein PFISCL1PPCAC_20448 [Pristionchus fissidentatus]|uniref:IMD domain-containing protein n=1 Tax=Pristionchus fissidentatus TaxID=1538716 RepID=A0AAV5WE51_9BILA|nr:hypothetical protein PFISCL1PPCAC_20448 [Pristionchus fissidentatus]
MVVMDPDTEFNALATLYQSVVADMKSSYPAWEVVGQRAVKLAAALKTTATALAAFNDSVQQVSDLASNLKGASRDVGACVTRICMRQRALEGRIKGLSDALGDELAVGVHARTAFWKARTAEMDKSAGKHLKKTRSCKKRPDETAMTTQRALCKQLLAEQRTQFGFFLSQLQPVLTAEVALLDEASHIRPVVESLENTTKHVDGEQLVETILADLTQGAESAWKTCLSTAGASFSLSSSTTTTSSEGDADGGSRMTSPSMGYDDSYGPVSTLDVDLTPQQHHHPTHGQPIQNIYASLPHTPSVHSSHHSSHHSISATPSIPRPVLPPTVPINGASMHRNTLGRRLSSISVPVPPTPTSLSASPTATENSAVSSFRGSASELRLSRPQSFVGNGLNGGGGVSNYAVTPLLTPATTIGGGGVYGASSSFSCGGSSTSSSASNAAHQATSSMIAETVQAIEGLGNDLDHFCTPRDTREQREHSVNTIRRGEYASSDVLMKNNGGAVRVRPESSSRPPPPSRRSSAITSATPSAPSIAEARMSMMSGASSSLRTSRQSLVSDGGASHEAPPTSTGIALYNLVDTTPVPFRPQSQYAAAGYGRQY